MSRIKVTAGQRWLRSTGPRNEDNVILHIIEATSRRFLAVSHIAGYNNVKDDGALLGVECEKVNDLITHSCVLMQEGETYAQCLAREATQNQRGPNSKALQWRQVRKGIEYPIIATRGDTSYVIDLNSKHEYPFSLSFQRKHHAYKPVKARWATLAEAKSRCF